MSQSITQNPALASMSVRVQQGFEYLRRLPPELWRALVMFFAIAWMVKSAATLFWVVFPVPEAAQPPRPALPLQTNTKPASTSSGSYKDLAPLGSVFGTSAPAQVAATPVPQATNTDVDSAKNTKLNLKLHGLFASSDPKRGSAIIAAGKDQKLYSVDDEIEGNRGVKLARVLDRRVILNNRGSMESLWLFEEGDFKAPKATPKPTPRKPSPNKNLRTTARPDQLPKNIGDVVRFSVHREGGKMIGYRIRPGRDRDLFAQVGLKANDIVTSVNGIEVNDPKQIRSVYKSMKTATEAQLTVLRDGQTHSITISLDSGE